MYHHHTPGVTREELIGSDKFLQFRTGVMVGVYLSVYSSKCARSGSQECEMHSTPLAVD